MRRRSGEGLRFSRVWIPVVSPFRSLPGSTKLVLRHALAFDVEPDALATVRPQKPGLAPKRLMFPAKNSGS